MEVIATALPEVKRIRLKRYGDARGFFVERFNDIAFAEAGLPTQFVQDNHSRSAPGVLRGLHYQHTPPQGKLVGAIRGRIFDVAVDIRPASPNFGKWVGYELSDENAELLWIPAGFAHGFAVLGNELADVYYKCTGTYNAAGEGGLKWDDKDINVEWPFDEMVLTDGKPLISARDEKGEAFADYKTHAPKW